MLFAIDIGHNCPPADTGAVGIKKECNLAQEVGLKLISHLVGAGHEIILVTPQTARSVRESLRQRCYLANRANADYYISIHFNAFNGEAHGTENFAISRTGWELAESINDEIASLGFRNRGVKKGDRLFVLRGTKMPAVLVECCFCDSQKDMDLYNGDKMAIAIFTGIQKFLDLPIKNPDK